MPFFVQINFFPPAVTGATALKIYESGDAVTWTLIDETTDIGVYPNYITEFGTPNAVSADDYFSVSWVIAGSETQKSTPVRGGTHPSEIMASLEDIQAELPDDIVSPTYSNTALIQISVARRIRGYMSRIVDNATLVGWDTPLATPDLIRTVAAKFIAAQLYANEMAKTGTMIEDQSFPQRVYNEAMTMLNGIIDGTMTIPDLVLIDGTTGDMSIDDFFPIDSTDRAFTMGQQF